MTPDELRGLAEILEYPPVGHGPNFDAGWDRFGEANDWLSGHGPDLVRLCAELGEALKAIGEVAFVAHEGDPWYAEHEGIDAEIAFAKYRAALAKLAELEAR